MNRTIECIKNSFSDFHPENVMDIHEIYPGITLAFISLKTEHISLKHKELEHVLEINYCHQGRIGWTMGNGNTVYLGAGDFSLHMMSSCANSTMSIPNSCYNGITIYIDLQKLNGTPPEILKDSGINGDFLYEKFCKGQSFTSLAGNEENSHIFSAFYGQPQDFELPYWKVKIIELLLYLAKLNIRPDSRLSEYQSEQIELVRKIHEQMLLHMEQKFTIDMLAKQYHINPTTLKTVFKSVYGNSIAAHVKEHRMHHAARILLETDNSLSEIALSVGYESQSKFTAAFKDYFGVLPKDYRKNPHLPICSPDHKCKF